MVGRGNEPGIRALLAAAGGREALDLREEASGRTPLHAVSAAGAISLWLHRCASAATRREGRAGSRRVTGAGRGRRRRGGMRGWSAPPPPLLPTRPFLLLLTLRFPLPYQVGFLLEEGADPELQDARGKTPYEARAPPLMTP
jgi:hypothetical protein